jgi:hypothetical protein
MTFLQSIETWVAVQIGIDLCLIILFLVAIRQIREFRDQFEVSSLEDVQKTIQPVLEDAKELAERFEVQLKEKQEIIRRLNFSLDDRIIGLNLLLKRAGSTKEEGPVFQADKAAHSHKEVERLQKDVIRLSEQGLSSKKIAANLGIARAEVDLVLDLKKRFAQLEQA